MGRNIGFRGILQRKYPHINISPCIIHREALASKDLSSVFNEVVQLVIKVVNFVNSRDSPMKMQSTAFYYFTQL